MSGEYFEFDLTDKGFAIFGERGGGKSWLTKSILDTTDSHIVYDPMREHQGYHQYLPTDRESIEEMDLMTRRMVIKWKPALVIYDEANKYIEPKPTRLPVGIADLVDFGRHWGISCGYVARRPVQFHTDIVELADFLFIFRLDGNNDYKYLEGLHLGLGDMVRTLPEFHFAIRHNGEITRHAPIPEPKYPNET